MSTESTEAADLRKGGIKQTDRTVMPQAPGVEKSLLSMMSIDPLNIISQCIADGMNTEFFYVPAHRILWEIFRDRYEKGTSIEPISVAQELTDKKQLEAVGGHAGLMDVFSCATTTALYSLHFATLKEKYIRRCIILAANKATEESYSGDQEVEALLDQTEQEVLKIRQSTAKGAEWDLKDDINKAVTNLERMMNTKGDILGLSTGFPRLDTMINGLKAGELFVIAARPSMGKTSFLLNIVEHIALEEKKPILVFSCEMPSEQLVERLLYARSSLNKQDLISRQGKLDKNEIGRFHHAISEMRNCHLIIDDTAAISVAELRAKARRQLRKHPDLAAIGIDYLQLMRSLTKQAQNSREREIAEISGGLKSLAKELRLPIIVLAQLNRGPENRAGKNKGTPMMSDLRESGAIEQDADMIGLLWRSSYYAEDDEERSKVGTDANLILAKNRNGPTGDVPLSFLAEYMRFIPRVPREGEEDEN